MIYEGEMETVVAAGIDGGGVKWAVAALSGTRLSRVSGMGVTQPSMGTREKRIDLEGAGD